MRVSLEDGRDPVWSRDGRLLYYSAGFGRGGTTSGSVMAADFSGGPNLTVARREKVLTGPYILGRNHPGFDVSTDGRLVLVRDQRGNGQTIVVHGWNHELRALSQQPGTRN